MTFPSEDFRKANEQHLKDHDVGMSAEQAARWAWDQFTPVVQVGQYEIHPGPQNDKFWILHESGEGMEVKGDSLEALITQFWADNF